MNAKIALGKTQLQKSIMRWLLFIVSIFCMLLVLLFASTTYAHELNTSLPPDFQHEENYVAGDEVRSIGGRYRCKPWPYSGWCPQVGYTPGASDHWQNAWDRLSNQQSLDYLGELSPYVSGMSYQPGSAVIHQGQHYRCKGWPASGWCGQAAYEPGEGLAWQNAWETITLETINKALWVSASKGIIRLLPETGQIGAEIPATDGFESISFSLKDKKIWGYAGKSLHAFTPDGLEVKHYDLANVSDGTVAGFTATQDRIWLAIDQSLYLLNAENGTLLKEIQLAASVKSITLDESRDQLWLATLENVIIYDKEGVTVYNLPVANETAIGFRQLAYDAFLDQVWLNLSGNSLRRYSAHGQLLLDSTLAQGTLGQSFQPDGKGGLWTANATEALHLNNNGQLDFSFVPFQGLSSTNIVDLAVNRDDQSAWVANETLLKRYNVSGQQEIETTPDLGDGIIRSINQLAFQNESGESVIAIMSPANGSFIKTASPVIELKADPDFLSLYSLQIQLDNTVVAATCEAIADQPAKRQCTLPANLSEGERSLKAKLLNNSNEEKGSAESTFTVDTVKPEITVETPAQNSVTNTPQVSIQGQLSEKAALSVGGQTVSLAANNSFDHTVTLVEGSNAIALVAKDLAGNSNTFTLNLTYVSNNVPVITSTPVTSAQEGMLYRYAVTATDADNDILTFSLVQAPTGMAINAAGLIQWTSSTAGTVPVTVKVADGKGGEATQTYSLVVIPNQPPVISSTAVTTAAVDVLYQYQVQASDPNGEAVQLSLSNAPLGMNISNTGLISWKPISAGTENVTIIASDTVGNQTQQNYTITVDYAAGNLPPVLSSIADQTIPLGSRIALTLNATDPEGRQLTYSVGPLPLPIGATLNSQTGAFVFEPASAAQVGSFNLTFSVNDGRFTTTQTVSFTVTAPPAGTPTSFSGIILDANSLSQGLNIPLVGATVSFLNTPLTTVTDSDGRFTLDNISTDSALVFAIDGSTANDAPGGASYASFREGLHLIPNVHNIEERPFSMPRIDSGSVTQVIPVNATTVTNEALGITLQVPANTAMNTDGSQFTGQLSISEVPRDLAPAALPEFLDPGMLLTIQPAGLEFTTPIRVTFPNVDDLPPGTELDIWSVDPTTGQFEVVGTGRVTANRQSIETISGGIRRATWHAPAPQPPPEAEETSDSEDPQQDCEETGSSTCLNDGKMTNTFELPAYRSLETNRSWRFVYQTNRAEPQPIVPFKTRITAGAARPNTLSALLEVGGATPGEGVAQGREVFFDVSKLPSGRDMKVSLTFDASELTTGLYPYRIATTNNFNASRMSSFSNGELQVINEQDSSFGAGWMLSGLYKLAIRSDGTALSVNPGGRHVVYRSIEGTNNYTSPDGNFSNLKKNADNTYTLTDKYGNKSHYNVQGLMTGREDRNGNMTQYAYGVNDRLETITDPVGLQTQFSYFAGRMRSVTDPAGRVTRFEHDALGNLIKVIYPDDSHVSYAYDGRLMTTKTDERNNVTQYEYDKFKRNIAAILPDSSQRAVRNQSGIGLIDLDSDKGTKSNPADFILDETATAIFVDARGNARTKDLNDQSKSMKSIDEVGRVTEYERNEDSLATIITRPNSSIVNRTFDDKGNVLTSTEQFNGAVNTYTYDNFSLVKSYTNPRNHTTTFNRDTGTGNLLSLVNHLNHTTTYQYDSRGLIANMTEPNGLSTDYTYNSQGLLATKTETPASGPGSARVTTYSYDIAGLLEALVTPDGITYNFTYDQRSRPLGYTDNLGQRMTLSYDDYGNVIQMDTFNADGSKALTNNRTYDERNRLTHVSAPHAPGIDSVVQYLLDPESNVIGVIDPNGRMNESVYDAADRLGRFIHREGGITDYQYDELDRITSVRAPNGTLTTFTYDVLGRRLTENSADRGTIGYSYDLANNLTQMIDARGITTTYSYDELERIISKRYPNSIEDVTYSYDTCTLGVGYLCTTNDESGSYNYSYDAFGNVIQVNKQELGQNYQTQYQYDAGDNLTQISYPTGRILNIQRDGVRRIQTLNATVNGGQLTLLSNAKYRGDNQLSQCTVGNGLVDNRTYDLQGRLTTQTLGSVDTRNYVYDRNGNILQRNTTPQVGLYTYDREDRLTSDAQNGGTPNLFTYDLNHNRLSKAKQDNSEQNKYDYSSLTNRLLSVETAITGNDPLPAEPSFTRTYNNANRWFELHEAGVKKADYIYNSQGQRTRKTLYNPDGSTASITIYHYNLDGQLIAETTETGAALKDYVWAGQNPVAQIDKQVANDEVNYLHTDHLATPRFATNQSDTIVWRWDGEAFGETEANEDPDGNATPTTVNLRFPGQYYDAESKLHYNYFRSYDPVTGRYTQSDPIGLNGGINTYGYVAGNPVSMFDSLGLKASGEFVSFNASVTNWNYVGNTPVMRSGMHNNELQDLVAYLNFTVSGSVSASIKCSEAGENSDCGDGAEDREWMISASVSVANLPFQVPHKEPSLPIPGMGAIIWMDRVLNVSQYMVQWRGMIKAAGIGLFNSATSICNGGSAQK